MIFEYALNDVEQDDVKGMLGVVWKLVKPQLDSNNRKHSVGALGGRPKAEEKTSGYEKKKPVVSKTKNHRLSKPKTNGYDKQKPNVNDNGNVNDNDNDNAQSETEKNQKPLNNIFEDIDKGCVAVSKWFERIAYPKDKKHLYPDIITDENRIVWAEQWCEISQHPILAKYSAEQRNRPFAAYDDRQNLTQSFLKTLVEFAFVIKRDTYGEYFKDLNYLIEERNGKLNIDNLATAYQRWLSGEEKKSRDMFPTLGN